MIRTLKLWILILMLAAFSPSTAIADLKNEDPIEPRIKAAQEPNNHGSKEYHRKSAL